MTKSGQIHTSGALSYSGSGILKSITVVDSSDGSQNYDATIVVNIDGVGAQTITLNNLKLDIGNVGSSNNHIINSLDGETNFKSMFFIEPNLEFTTSLAVTVSNANSFIIEYEREVY